MSARKNPPPHAHCFHIGSPSFGLSAPGQSSPAAFGRLTACCGCGRSQVQYMGIEDGGTHGPYVAFIARPATPSLLVPPKAGLLI